MNKKRHKSIYFLALVFIVLTIVVFGQITNSYVKTSEKERELAELQEALANEQARNEELRLQYNYIETDDFIIKKAREEFNLIQEGEILFIQEESE